MKKPFKSPCLIHLLLLVCAVMHAQAWTIDSDHEVKFDRATHRTVFKQKVHPHWLKNGESFWYQNRLPEGGTETILINARTGQRKIVDRPPEVTSSSHTTEIKPSANRSDIDTTLRFINRSEQPVQLFWINSKSEWKPYKKLKPGETYQQPTFEGHVWVAQGENKRVLGVFEAAIEPMNATIEAAAMESSLKPAPTVKKANVPWKAFVRDHNIWIRHTETRNEKQLSDNGSKDFPYRKRLMVSPDGRFLMALQVEPAQERTVYLIESSPEDQIQPKLDSYKYLKPGDRIAHTHLRLFDLENARAIPIENKLFTNPWAVNGFHWAPDSSNFFFRYNQRGHQVMRVLAIDATTGNVRTVVEETSPTFIDYSSKTWQHWLDDTNELIWMSERDGWNHLYRIDTNSGAVKSQITKGAWNVRNVEHVDAEQRTLWLKVMGVNDGEDPYHMHLARVNFDGTDFTLLTEGDGTHEWQWSPDRSRFIDTWSRIDMPPTSVLRDARDGRMICELETADIRQLLKTAWPIPERFTAKGRDGKTDIYGVIYRPSDFDPKKSYPVIEDIYAGPHDFFVPKRWSLSLKTQNLAELGFIVVKIDGMGTNWRGKAFHDICWKNLKDAGFPDRIAWIKAAATTRPWMDLTRVGIFGTSAGGQSALGALLFHGDFYKTAVAICGCHDNRVDKIWWNEAWMGWPVGPEYAASSNVVNAAKLAGDLLLIVGELDRNVDPASTMQVANALIDAGKYFELLVVPGAGHNAGSTRYANQRRIDFLVRNLLHTNEQ